jgi:S-adenosylmethionine:tRNA ribosyltransferase-isomerase
MDTTSFKLNEFDYNLPDELIAQHPAPVRDQSRLLVLDRKTGAVSHHTFKELPSLLPPHTLLVFNNTRVFPARLLGRKIPGGAAVELLLTRRHEERIWEAMVRPGRKLRKGDRIDFGAGAAACTVLESTPEGRRLLRFDGIDDFAAFLEKNGLTPLPPYIKREKAPLLDPMDRERYQTVYAEKPGAVAAPTAGLHFTDSVLRELKTRGLRTIFITLHVGPGTFIPVKVDDIRKHKMEEELYEVSAEAARFLEEAFQTGGKILAVGTSSVRVLESLPPGTELQPHSGNTELFITPGFRFQRVSAMLTNFHLPRSTNLVLVSAFAGIDLIREAYRQAIRERYRFYSYGDAMLIL